MTEQAADHFYDDLIEKTLVKVALAAYPGSVSKALSALMLAGIKLSAIADIAEGETRVSAMNAYRDGFIHAMNVLTVEFTKAR